MTIEEFKKWEPSFEESMFYSKINLVFIKLMTARMTDKLEEVKHLISDDLYEKEKKRLKDNQENGIKQMYDELNVKDSEIVDIKVNENVYIIKVCLHSRYMDYIINLSNGNLVSGNNSARVQRDYMLIFEKKKDAKEQGIIRRCPGCGASINVNSSGICEYCGTTYNLEHYDWILSQLEIS